MTSSATRILRLLGKYKMQFFIALICTVIFGASEGGIPFLIKYILDGLFAGKNEALLIWLPVGIVAFACFRALFDFLQAYLLAKLGHVVVQDLRNSLNDKILTLSPSYFIRERAGDLLSRVTSDVTMVRSLFTESIASIIRDTIRIIALLTAALYLDPILALLGFIIFPIAVYPVMVFGKKVRKLSRQGQDGIGMLSNLLQQTISGSKVVQVFGQEEYEKERYREENEKLTKSFIKSEKNKALTGPVNEVLAAFAIAGVVIYGGYSVIEGYRSQGDFIAFLAALFLLYEPFKKLSKVYNASQQGLAAADRIYDLLDAETKIKDPVSPIQPPNNTNIHINNVTFNYEGSKENALNNISLTINEGETVALVGFSGAGKSTLVDLIPRFIDPLSGQVLIGGVDIKQLKLKDLRKLIAMVGQHTFLFNDTIFQNIAYGKPDATVAEVKRAAEVAFAARFIEKLPNGYSTRIGEGGFTLSGGERQRIAIARAVLKDAPILILDEATASLDNQAEREVQEALYNLEKERTSLVIAHRISTVLNADKIVVMNKGQIVEIGKHDELLKNKGLYSELYELQFSQNLENGQMHGDNNNQSSVANLKSL